jgi:hypothetical protein
VGFYLRCYLSTSRRSYTRSLQTAILSTCNLEVSKLSTP